MHDKNGNPLKKGDKVLIEAVITETYATDEFCNIQCQTGYGAENSAYNVHGFVTINSRQVIKDDSGE